MHGFDVVVYGGTAAGTAAAIAAAAAGNGTRTVALVEPLLYLGGMVGPGGLGLQDQIWANDSLITGTEAAAVLFSKFCMLFT